MERDYVRVALREAMDLEVGEEEWKKFVEELENRKGQFSLMYRTSFRMKANNVPVLSKEEIDNIAEKFLMDFNPEALVTPQPIDEDRYL